MHICLYNYEVILGIKIKVYNHCKHYILQTPFTIALKLENGIIKSETIHPTFKAVSKKPDSYSD